eukprot:2819684-Amphidinium_carterae.1
MPVHELEDTAVGLSTTLELARCQKDTEKNSRENQLTRTRKRKQTPSQEFSKTEHTLFCNF